MSYEDSALQKMTEGYNCAQAILYSASGDLGIDPDAALKLATGFGAGMGRRGEVCGAVTGGMIALGARYGRGANDGKPATELTYEKDLELMRRFEAAHGTIICRELLGGLDLMTAEGKRVMAENDLGTKVCRECVRSVARILDEML